MTHEQLDQTGNPAKKRSMIKTIAVVLVLLIVAFLAGFVPPYMKQQRLGNELRTSRQQVELAEMRDLAGLAFLQVSQKDFGLASATTTRFFDRSREVANRATDPNDKKALEELSRSRDKITAELAQGDPAALSDLQALYIQTRNATSVLPAPSTAP